MTVRESILRYCAYQERCHSEVRTKLLELGSRGVELDCIIADLISDGILNEERFARSFARGRFRVKHWGRIKIMYELKARKISDYCIRKAMTEIDPEEYDAVMRRLCEKKAQELKGTAAYQKKGKIAAFLAQRGFENDLVRECIRQLMGGQDE